MAAILEGLLGSGAGGAAASGAAGAGGMSTLGGGAMTAAPTAAAAGGAGAGSAMLTGTGAMSPSVMQLLTAKDERGMPGWAQLMKYLPTQTPSMSGGQPQQGNGGMPQLSPLTMRLIEEFMKQILPQHSAGGHV